MTEHNIFQEIEAELEQQKLEDLWKRYGGLIITAAVVVILATAGLTTWHSFRDSRDQKASAGLTAAIEAAQANPGKEIDTLENFARANSGTTQAAFARLHAASYAAEQGDVKKAVEIYDSVANDRAVDTAFRQLADVMAVRAQLDTGDTAALEKKLQPLMAEGAPWRFTAMEYDGFVSLRAGDKAGAAKLFTELTQNAAVPHTIAARAADMLRYVSE